MIARRSSSGHSGSPRGSLPPPLRPAVIAAAPPTGSASLAFTPAPAAASAVPFR
jgi:hypothetical protein